MNKILSFSGCPAQAALECIAMERIPGTTYGGEDGPYDETEEDYVEEDGSYDDVGEDAPEEESPADAGAEDPDETEED